MILRIIRSRLAFATLTSTLQVNSAIASPTLDVMHYAAAAVDDSWVYAKLSTYCRACHGIGQLKFFNQEVPGLFFDDICQSESPVSRRVWAAEIISALSWPSEAPPPVESRREGTQKDWMPKGAKRIDLASDTLENVAVRRLIVDYLHDRCHLAKSR